MFEGIGKNGKVLQWVCDVFHVHGVHGNFRSGDEILDRRPFHSLSHDIPFENYLLTRIMERKRTFHKFQNAHTHQRTFTSVQIYH